MVTQDTNEIKNKIVQNLKFKGPMLPAYIAKDIGLDMLLTSAFLSELLSEKRINASHMRVGSSAIYYLNENFQDLEKYSEHLKSKEKEAFKLIKEKQFLEDENQEPAIRVALRQIRDFAFPFKLNEKIIWRYLTIQESEYKSKQKQLQEKPKQLNIFDKKQEPEQKIKIIKKKITKPKTIKKSASAKKGEQFFNKVKEFLTKEQKEITDILGVTKDTLTLKIRNQNQEILLIAFNKKRINETDITKAHKKAQELKLKYSILSLGDLSKKLDNLISAIKELSTIEKIE